MFRPFARLASSIKRQAPGLRLGLTFTSSRGVSHRAPLFFSRPTLSTFPHLSSSETASLRGREFKRAFSFVPSSFARSSDEPSSARRHEDGSVDSSSVAMGDADAVLLEQEVAEQGVTAALHKAEVVVHILPVFLFAHLCLIQDMVDCPRREDAEHQWAGGVARSV